MADVLRNGHLRWVLVAIAVAKGLDAAIAEPELAVAWLAAALAVAVRERIGCALLALMAFSGAATDMFRMTNHVVLVGWVAAVLAIWPDDVTRVRLLRTQMIVLYVFAGLSKINPEFLSGDVIASRRPWLPLIGLIAVGAILAEWSLAFGLWRRAAWVLPLVLIVHVSLVVGWTVDFFGHGPGILVFNALALAVVWAVQAPTEQDTAAAPASARTSRAA